MIRAWLELARISNLPTVWTNVTAGWLLAGGALTEPRLGWLLLAGSLLYTGGMILNDAADARFDAVHRQERPIPQGQVRLGTAWAVGLGMMAAGGALAVLMATAHVGITSALVACILCYDLYHKPWSGAVWVMGACRVLLFLMAASASGTWRPHVAPALILGAYIVGLTLVARQEAKKGTAPLPSRLLAMSLLCIPALSSIWETLNLPLKHMIVLWHLPQLATLLLPGLFALWVLNALRVMRRGGPAIGQAVGLLLAGIPLVDALAVSQVSMPLACGFALLPPGLRLWQRWIAAT